LGERTASGARSPDRSDYLVCVASCLSLRSPSKMRAYSTLWMIWCTLSAWSPTARPACATSCMCTGRSSRLISTATLSPGGRPDSRRCELPRFDDVSTTHQRPCLCRRARASPRCLMSTRTCKRRRCSGSTTTPRWVSHLPECVQFAARLFMHAVCRSQGITRLNNLAGLQGLYILRDASDDARLGLPSGPFEVPVIIQDRSA
jgi:hypothetical protein